MNSVSTPFFDALYVPPHLCADMAVFDALRHLSNYLYDAHVQNRHHLADLYELVQYAGNIVPRLYLMITVGSVYMSIPDAPVKEVMKDMLEMSRGVLHPIRGLFLRHYLSGQTRDHLPLGVDAGYVDFSVSSARCAELNGMQPQGQSPRLHYLRTHQFHRDEQAVGTTSASGPFKRPGEEGDGAARAAYTCWHEPRSAQPA